MPPKTTNQVPNNKSFYIILLLIILGFFVFNLYPKSKKEYTNVIFSDFVSAIQTEKVASVTIQGRNIIGAYKDGKEFKSYAPEDPELMKMLREHGVNITAKPDDEPGFWQSILVSWVPMLLLIGVWIFFMRQMQAGGGKA